MQGEAPELTLGICRTGAEEGEASGHLCLGGLGPVTQRQQYLMIPVRASYSLPGLPPARPWSQRRLSQAHRWPFPGDPAPGTAATTKLGGSVQGHLEAAALLAFFPFSLASKGWWLPLLD